MRNIMFNYLQGMEENFVAPTITKLYKFQSVCLSVCLAGWLSALYGDCQILLYYMRMRS